MNAIVFEVIHGNAVIALAEVWVAQQRHRLRTPLERALQRVRPDALPVVVAQRAQTCISVVVGRPTLEQLFRETSRQTVFAVGRGDPPAFEFAGQREARHPFERPVAAGTGGREPVTCVECASRGEEEVILLVKSSVPSRYSVRASCFQLSAAFLFVHVYIFSENVRLRIILLQFGEKSCCRVLPARRKHGPRVAR